MQVIKRDGSVVTFDADKIRVAITLANERTHEMLANDIERVFKNICLNIKKEELDVEEIQDLVEKTLMKYKFYSTAKEYIIYRDERTKNRENKSKLIKEIAEKINADNIVNQNANVDEKSFGGRKGEADNSLMK